MQNLKPNNLVFLSNQIQNARLSDDYASLVFKYYDELPDFTIKQLAKLVTTSKSRVIFNNKKKQISPRKQKLNRSQDDQIIQNLEINRRKTLATLSNSFPVSRFTIRRFGSNCPPMS